jgi:hypothetical protein
MNNDKAQAVHACRYLAEYYVQSFFPGLADQAYKNKVEEVTRMLANTQMPTKEGAEQVDHRTLYAGLYGNESFFDQTAGPLRQLITSAIEQSNLNLEDDKAAQDFYKKVVMFTAVTRGAIAQVADKLIVADDNHFGKPMEIPPLAEPFDATFNESQIYLARWLASDAYPSDLNNYEELKLEAAPNAGKSSPLGCIVEANGSIYHSFLNMLFSGSGLFKECMDEARRLRENPNDPKAPKDPEAQKAFTEAMKKFMYTWSQSSTCERGQAAMLMMLVDSMAKYAGCEFQRPEIPEKVKTTLAELSKKFPDQEKIKGTETDNGYTAHIQPRAWAEAPSAEIPRKNDEKWLQDFYYHPDVFALHMPSFAAFSERYPCTFIPIGGNQSQAG